MQVNYIFLNQKNTPDQTFDNGQYEQQIVLIKANLKEKTYNNEIIHRF